MITGWRVLKMRFMPSSTSFEITWNAGPRWSMVGRSIARSTRSGTLVGPGICRKWRPAGMRCSSETANMSIVPQPRSLSSPDSVKGPVTSQTSQPVRFARGGEGSRLALRLAREVDGEVLFDAASRGRYATDASIYQVTPVGVVVPRTADAAVAAMQIAIEEGIAVLPRGAGTSQCGQTVGAALIIDDSRYLDQVHEVFAADLRAIVAPGVVLDTLNAQLKPLGLWYPIDVSTSAQATLGGMAGNNSCGSRSLAYGNMVDRVEAIDAWLPTGVRARFGAGQASSGPAAEIAAKAAALWERERDEIAARFPRVARRVAGYNLDRLGVLDSAGASQPRHPNLAKLLVGSEGTLAWFERIHLRLAELPRHKA